MNQQREDSGSRRHWMVIAIFGLMAVLLFAQLGNLTIYQADWYQSEADSQRTRSLPIFAPRGLIYDRNGVALVTNRPAHSVFMAYPHYREESVRQLLAEILELEIAEIERMVERKEEVGTYYEPIRLKDDLSTEQVTAILENRHLLPGVEVVVQPVREYVHKELAAHILGYVSHIDEAELANRKKDGYLSGEMLGQTGLEAFYESLLRGKNGWKRIEIDNTFRPLGEIQEQPPIDGYNIHLTIDAQLQQVVERALAWTMWRIRNTVIGDGPWSNARAGAVVVMDVRTGEILAMASQPSFDPNLFVGGISQADWDMLNDEANFAPLLNRAVQTQYQPGSTWKMLTSIAALRHGVVAPYETYPCFGVYDKVEDKKDWIPWGHGHVDTVGALKGSCNIYYYEMGYRLGVDRLVSTAQDFGFGKQTGIDLHGEASGFLPTDRYIQQLDQEGTPWGPGYTLSAGIGQIVAATPVQMARYTATIANGGKLLQPRLVSKVTDRDGNVVKEFTPKVQRTVTIKPEHLQAVVDGMFAVNQPGGTSDFALYPFAMPTAGKTGSSEYPPQDDYGHYVAFAPLDNPEIAIALTIEQAAHGSSTSPVARSIFAHYFNVELPASDPARIPAEFPDQMDVIRRRYPVVGSGQ